MGLETPYQFHTTRRQNTFNEILQSDLPTRYIGALTLNAMGISMPRGITEYPDYIEQCERLDLKPFSRREIHDEVGKLDFPEDISQIRIPKNIAYGSPLYWEIKRLRTMGETEACVQVLLTDRFFPDYMLRDHPLLTRKGYTINWAELAFYDPKAIHLDTVPSQASLYLNPGAPFSVAMIDGRFRDINTGVSLFIEEDTSKQSAKQLIEFFKSIKEPTHSSVLPPINKSLVAIPSLTVPGSPDIQ